MTKKKPNIFIGSSTESIAIARAVQKALEPFGEVTVWDQNTFHANKYRLDDLTTAIGAADFGIFIFGYEDRAIIRDKQTGIPRDNVIFEAGMFIGRNGKERCFILEPIPNKRIKHHLPSDLEGITPGRYDPSREDKNISAAVGPACDDFSKSITQIGPRISTCQANDDDKLKSFINGAIQSVCRAVCVPITPERARLRVFVFRKKNSRIVCCNHWSPNPIAEMENKVYFDINDANARKVAVVRSILNERPEKETISPQKQKLLSSEKNVSEHIKMVLAFPILAPDGSIWGVVDFDSSNDEGCKLLNSSEAESAIFSLATHIKTFLQP